MYAHFRKREIRCCLANRQYYPHMRILGDVVYCRKPTALPAVGEETENALAGISVTQSSEQLFTLLIHGWKLKATTSSTLVPAEARGNLCSFHDVSTNLIKYSYKFFSS